MLANVRRQRHRVAFPAALPDHQAINMYHLPFIKPWVRGCGLPYGDASPVIGTTV